MNCDVIPDKGDVMRYFRGFFDVVGLKARYRAHRLHDSRLCVTKSEESNDGDKHKVAFKGGLKFCSQIW